MTRIIFLAIVLTTLVACQKASPPLYEETRDVMGTIFKVTVVQDTEGYQEAAHHAFSEIENIDRLMSTYKGDSDLSRVNRKVGEEPVAVSSETLDVARQAIQYGNLSSGALDVTVGPLVALWGFVTEEGRVPNDGEISEKLSLVDYRRIVLNETEGTIALGKEGMELDFGAIAKGYAVDKAVAALRAARSNNCIVEGGGDLFLSGTSEDGDPWRIGIRHPRHKDRQFAVIELRDKGIATSGDYESYFVVDGKRYCHIIDPRTGRPVEENMLSVTIVADTATEADALSTAVFVMGPEQGMKLVERLPGVETMIVTEGETAPGTMQIFISTGLIGKVTFQDTSGIAVKSD